MRPTSTDRIVTRLTRVAIRPTRQRVDLARILFRSHPRHVSAEGIWQEAQKAGVGVSLATVYNTLNLFVSAGLLRMVELPGTSGVFDTNTDPHHHVFDERTGELRDLAASAVAVRVEDVVLPENTRLQGIDVLVRVRSGD